MAAECFAISARSSACETETCILTWLCVEHHGRAWEFIGWIRRPFGPVDRQIV